MMKEFAFLGHPDKQADLIADLLVDLALTNDPHARCAIEVMVKGIGDALHVVVGGESSHAFKEEDICKACTIAHILGTFGRVALPQIQPSLLMTQQSPYITTNMGHGVGDQSIVVGFFGSTESRYHRAILYESAIFETLYHTATATGDGKMVVVNSEQRDTISVSVSGKLSEEDCEKLRSALKRVAMEQKIPAPSVIVNPPNQSNWLGGPLYDCGMTGRKLACDAHGVYAPHGGGATSGKDLSKPDRRMKILADMLAAELHTKVNQIQTVSEICVGLAFQMGGIRPIGVSLLNRGHSSEQVDEVVRRVVEDFDFTVVPSGPMVYRTHPWVKEVEGRMAYAARL